MTTTHVLDAADLRQMILTVGLDRFMDELIEGIHNILLLDPADVNVPPRDGFHYHKPYPGLVEWMPSRVGDGPVVIKLVGYHPQNPKQFNLPTILGTISIYDTTTGHLSGLVDGTFLTAMRTGATSAVATRVMARKEPATVGMIGCGAQAITQLHALSRVTGIRDVIAFDKNLQIASSLKDRLRFAGLDLKVEMGSIDEIVPNVDILCTATSLDIGEGPLFADTDTRPGLHVNAAGADFPGKTELARPFLLNSYVCPDHRAQARQQGECQLLSDDEIGDDLDKLIRNPDRFEYLRNERTVFDSTGLALADDVAASLALRYAREMNLGSFMQIEAIPTSAINPYDFLAEPIAVEV